MNQIELSIEKKHLAPEEVEMLIAYLLDEGFESFAEEEIFLKAFCPEQSVKTDFRKNLNAYAKNREVEINFTKKIIREKNWNEQWEKNFSPIEIENRVLIKAPFHRVSNLEFTVIIEPKMSFGTGHHETTRLMLREMMQADLADKEVLDMGCGTGVLGIVAKMMGASYLLAVDNDDWAFQNAYENFQRNNILQPWDVFPGDCAVLEGHTFHIILANINRNILLNDLPEYFKALKDHGTLIISGILSVDKEVLLAKAKDCGFTFVSSFYENNWISLNLRK